MYFRLFFFKSQPQSQLVILAKTCQNTFKAVLIRDVGKIKITLLVNIQLKQHHIIYKNTIYKHDMMCKKFTLKEGGAEVIKDLLKQ